MTTIHPQHSKARRHPKMRHFPVPSPESAAWTLEVLDPLLPRRRLPRQVVKRLVVLLPLDLALLLAPTTTLQPGGLQVPAEEHVEKMMRNTKYLYI